MKIFVVGCSQSGKTPFSEYISIALRCPRVGASEFFRKTFRYSGQLSRQEFTDAITDFSLEVLRRDPDVNVRHLRDRLPNTLCVVEGVRNPRDFVCLFDYRADRVVYLSCAETDVEETTFGHGVDVIRELTDYWVRCGLLDVRRVSEVKIQSFLEIEAAADNFVRALGETESYEPRRVHAELETPLRCHIRAEYLYDMDLAKAGQLVPGRVFSVSSYVKSAPTFQVQLDDGSVFSYLPPHAVEDLGLRGRTPLEPLEQGDLTYHDCPSENFCLHVYRTLAEDDVQAYFKRPRRWLTARYVATLDWYEGNDLLHLVSLENGQTAFLPQHKLKFGADSSRHLPPYKKLRRAFPAGGARRLGGDA